MAKIIFKKELEKLKKRIWEELKKYLIEKEPYDHYIAVNEYPRRQGKYFRPALVQLSTELYGGNIKDSILTAVAMQLSEDWLLVHDDFLDHSEERRSTGKKYKPALNKVYGDEVAVNAGDALHCLMWKVLGDNVRKIGEKRGWKIYDKMNDILMTTLEGQYLELDWIRNRRINITEREYLEMIYIKAGYYTVTGPLQFGAIIAGLEKDKINNIQKWGVPFGCAFQIWDDIMNLTVASGKQGKEKAGDIMEGKRTLILIHLLNHCSEIEKEYIQTIYSKKREDKVFEEKDFVLELMENYGSIEYAKKVAKNYSKEALSIFDNQTKGLRDCYAKEVIQEGIRFVVDRDC